MVSCRCEAGTVTVGLRAEKKPDSRGRTKLIDFLGRWQRRMTLSPRGRQNCRRCSAKRKSAEATRNNWRATRCGEKSAQTRPESAYT